MPVEIGVMASLGPDGNPFKPVREFGLSVCQLCNWAPALWTHEHAVATRKNAETSGVRVSAVWAGLSGPAVWNFTQGPATIGLVPDEHRRTRIAELKRAADFAALLEAPAIVTHLGFIPEDPNDGLYAALEDAVAEVAAHCESQGVAFWFETGQETPVTLLRLIEDLESDHVGINLDTANCVLYGKANPVDSLDVFGRYVRSLHAKDGFYPANGRELGREVALGQGKVDWPALWRGLKALGFEGDIIIEREIGGPEQVSDIRAAAAFLQSLTAT